MPLLSKFFLILLFISVVFQCNGYTLTHTAQITELSPSVDPALIDTAGPKRLLSVEGSFIVDAQDRHIQLRGIGLANDIYSSSPSLPDDVESWWDHNEYSFAEIASWGANTIRFYMHYSWFDEENLSLAWKYIDTHLEWAKNQGLYIILDLHFGPGETLSNKAELWTDSNMAVFKTIWTQIASKYKNNDIIAAYDLLNEPTPPHSPYQWWRLAQETITEIRSIGDDHIIIIETPDNHNRPFPKEPFHDKNIVYSFHFYEPFEFTHQGTSWTGNLPDYISYPFQKIKYLDYIGGDYDYDGITQSTNGKWIELVPHTWSIPPPGANWGFIEFGSKNNKGTILIDDISLEKKNSSGTISNIPVFNSSFTLSDSIGNLVGWYPTSGDGGSGEFSWINYYGRTDSYCLSIGHTNDRGYKQWSQNNDIPPYYYPKFGFPADPQCYYRINGWIKADSFVSGWSIFQIHWAQVEVEKQDKNHLRDAINRYVAWAQKHEVPLYCGEFGVVSVAPGNMEEDWIRDVRSILEGDNMDARFIHWTYHVYRDYTGEYDPEKRKDFGIYSIQRDLMMETKGIDREKRNALFY